MRQWFTDNQNVARIIDVGSRKSGLQREASVFLRFAFIVVFLLSLNGCPDPEMSKRIILAVLLIWMTGLLVLTFFAF